MSRRYYEDEDEEEDPRPSRRRPDYQFEVGTAGILSAFAALAVLCGLFYAFGFTVGKHAVPASFSLGDANAAAPTDSSPANKPAAGTPVNNPAVANGGQPPNASDLTAAEVNQTPQTLVPGPTGSAPNAPDSGQPAATLPPAGGATGNSVATSSAMRPTPQPPSSLQLTPAAQTQTAPVLQRSWAVQVFAGAREGDALSLAAALKARQFPVFILKPTNSGDGLYHVQIGPYDDHNQAEQMRARLAADGYNAVIE